MKLYYMVKTSGKAGCASTKWRVTERYNTKASLKKAEKRDRQTIKYVHREDELAEVWGVENANRIMETAITW